jgi:hypothetical protein
VRRRSRHQTPVVVPRANNSNKTRGKTGEEGGTEATRGRPDREMSAERRSEEETSY